jgi:hypothetical protein
MQTKMSLNNLESKNNPNFKQIKDSLSNKHSGPRSRDYTLATRIKSQTCKIFIEKLSISKNQSNASFKTINQSINGIKISSQAIEEKLGGKIKIGSLQQFLQESSRVAVEHNATI